MPVLTKEAAEKKEQSGADRVVRAMTQDGAFRVIVATVSETAAEASRRQKAPEELANRLGQLMCGAVLVRETMQPGNRVQIILRDEAQHQLVADTLPDGKNRGIVNPGSEDAEVAAHGLLQVNYTLRNGELHQGVVQLEAGTGISTGLMRYLRSSEQIAAFIAIEVVEHADGSRRTGGFVLQITPEAEHEGLAAMTSHLESFDKLVPWLSEGAVEPTHLIEGILEGHEYALLADSPLCFGCTCSEERMLIGLSTLGQGELAGLLEDESGIEVNCDACGESYDISNDQLGKLLVEVSSSSPDLQN